MPTLQNTLLDCKNRDDLASLLGVSVQQLTYFAYSENRKYKTFEIPKKSGGKRKITAPIGALKTIQRKLAKHFNDLYPSPPYVHGFLNERSILSNATPHLNKDYVFNIDLKDFFPSITAGRIAGLLKSRPFNLSPQLASTIAGLTCYQGSLPQGAPTSPVLSNMICMKMDKALRKFSRQHGATYTRYADDITFSFNTSVGRSFPRQIVEFDKEGNDVMPGDFLNQIIESNSFKINPVKTRLSRNGQAKFVTGVKVNTVPNLSRRYVKQLKNMLHAWKRWGLPAAQARFISDFDGGKRHFENVVWGKLQYLKSIKSEYDITYAKLHNKFVDLEAKGRPLIPISLIEQLYSKVYVIQSEKTTNGHLEKQQGTGFLLNGKWLLTCGHVVLPDADEIKFYVYDRWSPFDHKKITANEVSRSNRDDFDLIELSFENNTEMIKKSFQLAPEGFEVEVGQEFKVIGFPNYLPGDKPRIEDIKVSVLNQNGSYTHAFVGQKLTGGFSGSPVIDNENRVVGIAMRGEEQNTLNNAFLPIQELRKYLSSLDR